MEEVYKILLEKIRKESEERGSNFDLLVIGRMSAFIEVLSEIKVSQKERGSIVESLKKIELRLSRRRTSVELSGKIICQIREFLKKY
ncbi:MAG: hypothetical protein WCW93_02710 [Candidatus Paceibacterota bacterium]